VRDDVSLNKIIFAVSTAIEANFDRGDWAELGILNWRIGASRPARP
jgi:hypothetical protein